MQSRRKGDLMIIFGKWIGRGMIFNRCERLRKQLLDRKTSKGLNHDTIKHMQNCARDRGQE